MSKLLDAVLDTERMADCTKHDIPPRHGHFVVIADTDGELFMRTNDREEAVKLSASIQRDFGFRSTIFQAINV